jgi:hypothetical protein
LYSRPVSSLTALRAAQLSGHGRGDWRYAPVAHRRSPRWVQKARGTARAFAFSAAATVAAVHGVANLPARAACALSPADHNVPVSPLDHRGPHRPRYLPHHAATTADFELVKRSGGNPRSSPDLRASWPPSTPNEGLPLTALRAAAEAWSLGAPIPGFGPELRARPRWPGPGSRFKRFSKTRAVQGCRGVGAAPAPPALQSCRSRSIVRAFRPPLPMADEHDPCLAARQHRDRQGGASP